jgi:hypothetical protein
MFRTSGHLLANVVVTRPVTTVYVYSVVTRLFKIFNYYMYNLLKIIVNIN